VGGPVLVPVGESATLRQTVAYAVEAAEAAGGEIHFVASKRGKDTDGTDAVSTEDEAALLERVEVWAREDATDALTVETAVIGVNRYLFAPDDYAREIEAYATARGIERVVVDPEYNPGSAVPLLRPMTAALVEAGLDVETPPVDRPTRREEIRRGGGAVQFATLFGLSFLFYQLLGGFALTQFDLFTGGASAVVVAAMLHRISFSDRMELPTIARRAVRLVAFVPYLLYEIVYANLLISYVILHPRLPIEPRMTELDGAVWGGMPVATLANSITLTPGTLSVRVEGRRLTVHTLVPAAREGLFDGGLERAVRFLFYGRTAAGISSPRERDDCRILDPPTVPPSAGGATEDEAAAPEAEPESAGGETT
jgi:multicomponent Na+:H+ antiporter subunit E